MNQRRLGKTGRMVSEIGLGTWQLGTKWGDPFNETEAQSILEASYESGIYGTVYRRQPATPGR